MDNNTKTCATIIIQLRDRVGVATILVRYCEIGLKSTPVRRKFENQLRDNILSMLVADKVEAFISHGDARFFLETEMPDECAFSLRKVFGIGSISIAAVCSSDLDDICKTAAEYSRGKMSEGQGFAVRARREGTHDYTSMDLGREAGSAIFNENKPLGVKVNLTDPEKIFYIEVRNNKAYIFDEYIPCPGGLPMGTQGKVVAEIKDERGVVSAWLMMKRGCRIFATGNGDLSLLRMYDPSLRVLTGTEADGGYVRDILGRVLGTTLETLDSVGDFTFEVPIFYPTIGMCDSEVNKIYSSIAEAKF